MTGPDHYAEAERLLAESTPEPPEPTVLTGMILQGAPEVIDVGKALQAQVHATLALAAATVDGLSPVAGDRVNAAYEWSGVSR